MLYFFYIFIAILILLIMITIHELGHYLAAKALRFKVNEFSIGCGTALFQRKLKGGEVFSIRVLPLGGYCAFASEYDDDSKSVPVTDTDAHLSKTADKNSHNVEENSNNVSDETQITGKTEYVPFERQKPYKRIIVMLAGAFFNLFSAFIFAFIYILIVGYSVPQISELYVNTETNEVYAVELQKGDKILEVDGKRIGVLNTFDDLTKQVQDGESVKLLVSRNGELEEVSVTKQMVIYEDDEGNSFQKPMFGFSINNVKQSASFAEAITDFVPYTFKLSWAILGSLGQMITGQIPISEMTGPIGTVTTIATYTEANWQYLLLFLPLIASNLAIFNLLPFPGLDGAKVVFTLIEWIRGKPINRKIENAIHAIGMLILFAFVIIVDIIGFVARA